jgi:SAM-dependent methyltransferase
VSISQRYLEAKRTVDDRALNCRILSRLSEELEAQGAPSFVDIGAGIGIGLERYLELGLPSPCDYTAVDESASFLEIAERRLRDRVQGRFIASTLEDFSSDPSEHGRFDCVLAHAFLDIVDLGPSLQALIRLARPGGLLYFPITFDGETIFEPSHPSDDEVLEQYHETIGSGGNGGSKTGRRLFHALATHPVDVLEIGSSDWIVHPTEGRYPAEEAFFLSHILEMIEGAVGSPVAKEWASARRGELEKGSLLYIAHQVDYLVRKRY